MTDGDRMRAEGEEIMADEQVNLVKSKIEIVDYIGERISLKRAGKNFKALCPFHGEKTPSFFVSPEAQTYKCFGCGEGGDILSFVQKYEGLSFPEALKQLADKAGVELKREYRTGEDQEREKVLTVLSLAAEYYHYILTEHEAGEKARKYLELRQVPGILIRDYKLGYAPQAWDGLLKYLKRKGYEAGIAEKAGLAVGRHGGGGYDRFRGRVMFPLRDFAGRVVGFSGRLLDQEAKEAKYINTPETSVYHKRELLFGLYESKQAIREADRVVIVEGELDVLSSRKAKVREAVAIKGSALTDEQALLVRRLTPNIVLALDADEAGQEALKRAIETAEKQEMNLKVAVISGGKDPDDLVKQDPKLWRELVKGAVSVYRYYIDWAAEKYDLTTGEGVKQASKLVSPVLAKIQNAVEQAYYIKLWAEKLRVGERVVEEEIAKARMKVGEARAKGAMESRKWGRRERLERYLIGATLQLESELAANLNELEAEIFSQTYLRKLWGSLKKLAGKDESLNMEKVRERLSGEMLPLLQDLYTQDVRLLNEQEEKLRQIWGKTRSILREMELKEGLMRVSRELSQPGIEGERRQELHKEYRRLEKELREVKGEGGNN